MNNTIPAVDKSVQVLLSLARQPASQAELSKSLGISMSTAFRLLTTLSHHRWVRKNDAGKYLLSDGLLPLLLGLPSRRDLMEKAEQAVQSIARDHHIACKFSIRQGDRQLTCYRAEPPGPVALTGDVHSTFPLIEGTVGAALLSGEDQATIESLIANCPEDIPEREHPELVFHGLEEIRRYGVTVNLRKNRWNIAALSIPLHLPDGTVLGALTLISSPDEFAGDKRAFWVRILKEAIKNCER